jgi:hypothetical protein
MKQHVFIADLPRMETIGLKPSMLTLEPSTRLRMADDGGDSPQARKARRNASLRKDALWVVLLTVLFSGALCVLISFIH